MVLMVAERPKPTRKPLVVPQAHKYISASQPAVVTSVCNLKSITKISEDIFNYDC